MDTDAIMREMQASFRIEAEELVTDLEEGLLELESDNDNGSLIDRVFRSLHTLKGSGSSAGFLKLAAFLHIFEDAFNLAREGKLNVTQELIDLSLQTVDRITEFVGEAPNAEFDKKAIEQDAILVELRKLMPEDSFSKSTVENESIETKEEEIGIYKIAFKPYDNFTEFGNEPITVIDELRSIGELSLKANSKVPELSLFDPETTYLSWEIELVSLASHEDVEEIFSFVDMDADITIKRDARIYDLESKAEGLFDPITLSDYEVESQLLLKSIKFSITPSSDAKENKTNWKEIERCFHSFKGNSGILLSSATNTVSNKHPLRYLEVLAEAGQNFAAESQADAVLVNDEARYKVAQELHNAINDNCKAFSLHYRPDSLNPELLAGLELDPEFFEANLKPKQKELSPIEEAFLNIFKQSLGMIEESLSNIDESNIASEFPIIKRALGNIKRASKGANKVKLAEACNAFEKESEIQLNSGFEVFLKYSNEQIAVLRKANEADQPQPTKTQSETKKPQQGGSASPAAKATLRVDEDKIDRLMRAIGELLVARGAFPLIAKSVSEDHGLSSVAQELREAGSNVSRLADELQSAVMSIRMRPLQTLFQRFPRMIRDVSKSLGKEINFVVLGEDTELDKTMVEKLGDPLVHILRNSLDHGVETTEERSMTNKAKAATITLEAVTEGATVAINIKDDGRGLNADKLKDKAIEKGLITPEEAKSMPESTAQELIMRPGFSTAEQVTDLSGRGVGMDVVANNIHKLNGSIEISSEFGVGTTITLRIPTSLLISEAILIKSGQEEYLIPMDNVSSLEKIARDNVSSHCGTHIVTIRNEVTNLVILSELLSSRRNTQEDSNYLNIALISTPEGQLGLIVDKFVNQEEIVIKSLSGELAQVRLFAGVSIMGDGRLVPVLNAREINNYYLKRIEMAANELAVN